MQLIGLILPEGFETGSFYPLSVFETANAILGSYFYETVLLSEKGGLVKGAFGVNVFAETLSPESFDSLFMAGAHHLAEPTRPTIDFLVSVAAGCRRMAAIRLGAFTLGHAGLLDGRRVTTHWAFAQQLQASFPAATVEADSLYLEDRGVWTSAGMAAGADLAMSMVERDLGASITQDIARQLMMGQRRHARQQQRSETDTWQPKSDRVQRALDHARAHLRAPLTVEDLARAACLSTRQLSRIFEKDTGHSPARAVEILRLEAARLLVFQGRLAMATIALETGFRDAERMRRAFQRNYGQSPRAMRDLANVRVSLA